MVSLFYNGGNLLPLLFFWDTFYAFAVASGMDQRQLHTILHLPRLADLYCIFLCYLWLFRQYTWESADWETLQESGCSMRGEHSFAVPTKFFALLCAMLGIFLVKNILFTTVLVIFCFVYVGFQRNYRLMTSCGAFYLLLSLLLYAIRFWGYHTVIISEFLVLFFWSSMVMLMLFWDLFMTPPGELSSFLSSIHMPTGVILGLMVIFRFFPTMKAELKAVGLSMKNRGLTSVRQFAVHPLASVEYVLVPLLLRILQIADQLAVSAVARGAECPGVRKSYYETTMHMRDWCFLALWGIVTAAVLCVGGVKI